jgi:hypothetical protein
MTVGVGAQAKVWLDGFDMSDFFREFAIVGDKMVHDKTVFANAGSREKKLGLKHGTANGVAFSDNTVNTGSWHLLKTRYGSHVSGLYVWGPYGLDTIGAHAISLYSEEISFMPQNLVEDLIKITVAAEAKRDALDCGVVLLGKAARTVFPTNGMAVDNGSATTNGGVGSVHNFAIAGASPSAVYRIQHSTNGTVWVDLITFTAIAAANQSQRVEVAQGTTVNRYLRATLTNGDTTTSATGGVAFARR